MIANHETNIWIKASWTVPQQKCTKRSMQANGLEQSDIDPFFAWRPQGLKKWVTWVDDIQVITMLSTVDKDI